MPIMDIYKYGILKPLTDQILWIYINVLSVIELSLLVQARGSN